jgi:two-component system cell cycle sensor histidine kinase PleC
MGYAQFSGMLVSRPDAPPRRRRRAVAGSHLPAQRQYEYELLKIFARNELLASLAVPMLAVFVAVMLMNWAPPQQLMLWLATVLMAKGILLSLCRQFQKQPPEAVNIVEWRRKITAAMFLYGMTWAVVAFVEFPADSQPAHFFLFAALIVVTSVRIIFAATVMPLLHAGTWPVTAALVLRFLMSGDPTYWIMAVIAVSIHLIFLFLVNELQVTVLSMLGLRAAKERLIAELEQAKAASDEARLKAEAANIAKSKFLANMSHELRTPLNAILGFSEMMKGEMLGPMQNPTYKSYAEDIHSSGQHLLKLINEILDLSRIEAGRYQLREEALDLADVAAEAHRILKLDAEGKGITVVEDFAAALPPLWADERAVRQVCFNLLSNALKFTPEGGVVTLRAGLTRQRELYLTVADNGPGIPPEEMPQVLSSFGQGSLAFEMGAKGFGLGLPIVKGLAELHGGRFDLKSKLGEGTEATVVFPESRAMPEAPQRRQPHSGGKRERWLEPVREMKGAA